LTAPTLSETPGYFNLSRQAYNPAMRGRLVQIVALGDNLLLGGQR
jgi:hypothetical protein